MTAWVPSGYDYKEITVRCGNTRPDGYPYLCDACAEKHKHTDWRQLARDAGEQWDDDY